MLSFALSLRSHSAASMLALMSPIWFVFVRCGSGLGARASTRASAWLGRPASGCSCGGSGSERRGAGWVRTR